MGEDPWGGLGGGGDAEEEEPVGGDGGEGGGGDSDAAGVLPSCVATLHAVAPVAMFPMLLPAKVL